MSSSSSSSSRNTHGIYNNSTGTIIIGNRDRNIDKEIITIEAEIGMRNVTGKLHWYDGHVIYSTQVLDGSVTEIEDNAQIVNKDGEGYLEIVEQIEWIQNTTTGKTYTDLQIAINETNTYETLQVIQDYTRYEEVRIDQEKQMVLNLNGKTMTIYGSIYNQGELQITDSEGNGNITSQVGTRMIENTGIVEISRRRDFY